MILICANKFLSLKEGIEGEKETSNENWTIKTTDGSTMAHFWTSSLPPVWRLAGWMTCILYRTPDNVCIFNYLLLNQFSIWWHFFSLHKFNVTAGDDELNWFQWFPSFFPLFAMFFSFFRWRIISRLRSKQTGVMRTLRNISVTAPGLWTGTLNDNHF